jgi:hypothetical protein
VHYIVSRALLEVDVKRWLPVPGTHKHVTICHGVGVGVVFGVGVARGKIEG